MLQTVIHYFLHLVFPGIIAWIFFRSVWMKAYSIFLLTMLVDLDHLLAVPVFDPCRCSVGFHPLHSYVAIMLYVVLLLPHKTRIPALGLVMHMLTDGMDCWFSAHAC